MTDAPTDLVQAAIADSLGSRCAEFDPDCLGCRTWAQFDAMRAALGAEAPGVANPADAAALINCMVGFYELPGAEWRRRFPDFTLRYDALGGEFDTSRALQFFLDEAQRVSAALTHAPAVTVAQAAKVPEVARLIEMAKIAVSRLDLDGHDDARDHLSAALAALAQAEEAG